MKTAFLFMLYLAMYVVLVMALLWVIEYMEAPRIMYKCFVAVAILGGLFGAVKYWGGDNKPLV
jgi:hypothetical protein